jgi:hypothetical protein
MIAVTRLSYATTFGVCSSRSFIASSISFRCFVIFELAFGKDLSYTYHPSCHQVYDVAKAIIQKFPYLCEKIGSGYDGWYIYIKDKLKNVRRKSDEPSEHDGAQLHPFGMDLFLATLVRVLSDILSFFLQVADGSSDFLRTFLSLSYRADYNLYILSVMSSSIRRCKGYYSKVSLSL